jgi:hypothetical protein
MNPIDFTPFPKIPRLSRDVIVTEKIDGTNASIFISEQGDFLTGSRNRWITPEDDNFGFSYGLQKGKKRFSLFNVSRWSTDTLPGCVSLVPVLYKDNFDFLFELLPIILKGLRDHGSKAAPGFMQPEGIIVFHTAGNMTFKKTLEKDDQPKGLQQ